MVLSFDPFVQSQMALSKACEGKWRLLLPGAAEPRLTVGTR